MSIMSSKYDFDANIKYQIKKNHEYITDGTKTGLKDHI